jgi:hypothetical protein
VKIELPDHLLPVVVRALESHAAAMQSLQRDDRPYLEAAEYFRQPEPRSAASEIVAPPAKRKRA